MDVLLSLPSESGILPLVAALRANALSCDARDFSDALRQGGHVTIFDEETNFHVDAKLARTAAERSQIQDGIDLPFHGGILRVARAEDTIAYKLKFGTDQDLRDARSILVRQEGRLDLARLQALAIELGVTEELKRLHDEIARAHG